MAQSERSALAGRHAVVTGGSRGIGLAIARALSQAGARVSVLSRGGGTPPADAAASAVRGDAPSAEPYGTFFHAACDVSDAPLVTRALDACRAENGPIAVLVNNAGVMESAPLRRTSDEMWSRTIAVNLTGTFLCVRAVEEEMREAGWGRIVNVASIAGLEGAPYLAAYCASKFGVVGLTKALALEYACTGVTVNAVCPGYVDTAMTDAAIANVARVTHASESDARARLAGLNRSGRFIAPEEVAAEVVRLCESGATGQTVVLS